jgi:hypothetical protein
MAKLTMTKLFNTSKPRAETAIDKTTRAAREILDEEMQRRQVRTSRLRKARLEREAGTPNDAIATTLTGVRNKPRAKAAK